MPLIDTVKQILDEVLYLHGAALQFTEETKLAGSIPQLDSMAIVSLIAALEEQLGVSFPEDELDVSLFETLGTLLAYIEKLSKTLLSLHVANLDLRREVPPIYPRHAARKGT